MENGLNKRSKISDLLCMLPSFVFTLSILLVRMHLFSMPMSDVYWSEATDTSTLSDVFNYWKAIIIMIAAGLALIVLAIGYFKDLVQFKKTFLYIPALVYSVFIFISLALSDYKYFALRGMSEHFEGTIVLLSYVMMLFFLMNIVDSERRLKYVIYCALGVTVLLGILGITQATGHDFLSTTMGQKLITPNFMLDTGIKSWDMIDVLGASGQKAYDFSFKDGEVYQTVYNINYVPLYLSLLIPVSAMIFTFLSIRKNNAKKFLSVLFLMLYGLCLYNYFAANSASGYFGLVAIFVTALILFHKHLKKWFKPIICLLVVLGLVMGILIDRWLPEVQSLFGTLLYSLSPTIYADSSTSIQPEYDNPAGKTWAPIDYIETNSNCIFFSINNEVLVVSRNEDGGYVFNDSEGNMLYLRETTDRAGVFEILDDRFHDYIAVALTSNDTHNFLQLSTRYYDWLFVYDGIQFQFYNLVGKTVSLSKVQHSSLIKDYAFASSRGRIWMSTIPMLSKYVLKGAGADCYTFAFPQNDYVTLYNTTKAVYMHLVTDKAHNFYMQSWVNTGLISLLAWLTLVGYYLVGAAKQFRKRGFVEFSDFVNGGIFCGIIGVLFVAFFNDGSVNTMPMFYTMLGTGLAINMKDKWVKTEGASGKKEAAMPEI